ncbi:hypothetical protein Q8G46_27735, partial [Klebsiella pneumoniae]|uniref:hypothetical protein n=1 Tax=Klebsiella pneumoniae TaxID=573 RepID=UPI003013CE32
ALALVVEQAVVTDESGNHVELKNLRGDGTIGEPEAEVEPEVESETEIETDADADAGEPAEAPAES